MTTTRKWSNAAVVAGLLLSLASHGAAAMDEVVVYGDDIALQARLAEKDFQARMSDYQKAVVAASAVLKRKESNSRNFIDRFAK